MNAELNSFKLASACTLVISSSIQSMQNDSVCVLLRYEYTPVKSLYKHSYRSLYNYYCTDALYSELSGTVDSS